ncbi:FAD-dependent monooxygenase [Streptomyces sp. NPDC058872]|uniref:FAD-dependent monooxygenase n=1 Tax=Streptomyces sp. NPDC058872 TaxID=3346661 RepID=UPI0036A9C25F
MDTGSGVVGSTDVCIVGAGPVGLALAIGLRRLSLRVRIVDRAPTARHKAGPLVLWTRARQALDVLGVGELLRLRGVELGTVTLHARDRALGPLGTGWALPARARPLAVQQYDVERLLREELARLGTRVEWNTEVTDVEVREDRAEFTLRHAGGAVESTAAPWIVGCDGTASVVRDRLGIRFGGLLPAAPQVVLGTAPTGRPLGLRPDLGHLFLVPHHSLLVFPLSDGGFRFFCFRDRPEPGATAAPTQDELRSLVADTTGVPAVRLDAARPRPDGAALHGRIAAELRRGRALLAGDAAHAWAPVGGLGTNIGILGAVNLAWKLAAVQGGQADEGLLDTYDAEQRLTAVQYLRHMRFDFMEPPLPPLGHRAFAATAPAAFVRSGLRPGAGLRAGAPGRSRVPGDHRGGPLSWHRSGRHRRRGPRAGDRMPDVRVLVPGEGAPSGTGSSLSTVPRTVARGLRTLLGYGRWTLVLYAARAEPGVVDGLRRACARFPVPIRILPVTPRDDIEAGRLGHPDVLWLVRPDGHVGLVAPVTRTALLRAYLSALAPSRARGVRKSRWMLPLRGR